MTSCPTDNLKKTVRPLVTRYWQLNQDREFEAFYKIHLQKQLLLITIVNLICLAKELIAMKWQQLRFQEVYTKLLDRIAELLGLLQTTHIKTMAATVLLDYSAAKRLFSPTGAHEGQHPEGYRLHSQHCCTSHPPRGCWKHTTLLLRVSETGSKWLAAWCLVASWS